MAGLERTTGAFSFRSDLSLAQMKEILNAGGRQQWVFGDSEWHGDYLGGGISPGAVVRIYATKSAGRFHLSLRVVTESGDPNGSSRLLQAASILLKQILPAIVGRDTESAEPFG